MRGPFSFINDMGNYDRRKLGRESVNGLEVSTAYTSDEGYETAIIDANGVHPVERYSSQEKAELGHKEWVEKAKTITNIVKLGGFMGLVEDEPIALKRIVVN